MSFRSRKRDPAGSGIADIGQHLNPVAEPCLQGETVFSPGPGGLVADGFNHHHTPISPPQSRVVGNPDLIIHPPGRRFGGDGWPIVTKVIQPALERGFSPGVPYVLLP